jgi:hypothetical protein
MKRMNSVTMVLAAILIGAVTGLNARADHRRYSENEIYDLAQRNGYQYGVREGRYDVRSGHRFDPKKNRAYKDGRYGYRDDYRHDGTYRDGFRNGFLTGYEDGYNGNRARRRDDDDDYRRGRRDDDDYDYRRSRRDDDDYDYRRSRRDDRDDDDRYGRNDRNNRNNRNNGWWDILTGAGGIYDDARNQRRRP